MSDSPEVTPRPDAILCPGRYPPTLIADADRHALLRDEFAPVLGVPRVYSRHGDMGRTVTFITGQPNDSRGRGISRYFATGHPRCGQERYAWTDRGDGVLYGTLTAEALADEQA